MLTGRAGFKGEFMTTAHGKKHRGVANFVIFLNVGTEKKNYERERAAKSLIWQE